MKKTLKTEKTEKLSLTQTTIRTLTDDSLANAGGGTSFGGCLFLTKPTTTQNGCR